MRIVALSTSSSSRENSTNQGNIPKSIKYFDMTVDSIHALSQPVIRPSKPTRHIFYFYLFLKLQTGFIKEDIFSEYVSWLSKD